LYWSWSSASWRLPCDNLGTHPFEMCKSFFPLPSLHGATLETESIMLHTLRALLLQCNLTSWSWHFAIPRGHNCGASSCGTHSPSILHAPTSFWHVHRCQQSVVATKTSGSKTAHRLISAWNRLVLFKCS
jgi:hypothetical protein